MEEDATTVYNLSSKRIKTWGTSDNCPLIRMFGEWTQAMKLMVPSMSFNHRCCDHYLRVMEWSHWSCHERLQHRLKVAMHVSPIVGLVLHLFFPSFSCILFQDAIRITVFKYNYSNIVMRNRPAHTPPKYHPPHSSSEIYCSHTLWKPRSLPAHKGR